MRIVFFGTPEFAVPSLEAVVDAGMDVVQVVAQPDRPAGRGMRMHSPAVAVRARELGLPLAQPERVRGPEFLEMVRGLSPDIGVVIAYGKILPQALLDLAPQGFLNVHGSVLPKYRGAAPIQRAIEAGEPETGVTIIRLDAEMDHGPMLAIAKTPIGADERSPALAARLARIGASTLVEVLHALERGVQTEREQDHAAATFANKILKEEGRVGWDLPARVLYNRFRAFDPWPGLFTDVRGETIKLATIEPVNEAGPPGLILSIGRSEAVVGTGDKALRLLELQRPGRRPAPAAETLRALGLVAGERLA